MKQEAEMNRQEAEKLAVELFDSLKKSDPLIDALRCVIIAKLSEIDLEYRLVKLRDTYKSKIAQFLFNPTLENLDKMDEARKTFRACHLEFLSLGNIKGDNPPDIGKIVR